MIRDSEGREIRKPAFPIILSGPAGAGKGVLGARLLEADPGVVFSVSATTRPPRAHERRGINYLFVSEAEFRRMIGSDELAEWAEVHNHLYGTPATFLNEQLSQGMCVLLDIDVQGGVSVMRRYPDALSVFVLPPSLAILRQRLAGRGTEDLQSMETRLDNARHEIAQAASYKYLIVNSDLDEAAASLVGIIRAERCRMARLSSGGIRLE
jgi:guanylate kinase